MADRNFNRVQSLEKEVKILFGSNVIGASGAVGDTKGQFTMTRTAPGTYTITMQDKYFRLLFAAPGIVSSTYSGIGSVEISTSPATLQSSFQAGSYQITCYNNSGVATDPAAGSVLTHMWMVRNSSVNQGND